jgi:hypothetical protein
MTATSPALPAGTALGFSYEYGLDVNVATFDAPVWQPVRRISDFNPSVTPVTQDAQTYDDFGAPNADKSSENWTLAHTVLGNRSLTTGLYLPELEAILARTGPEAVGEAAILHLRYYHKPVTGTPNPNDAFEGFATVAATRQNTGADGAVERHSITYTGKGPRKRIANPFAGWGVTEPVVAAATPAGAGEGEMVTITGAGFLGATGVKFGAANAAEFVVLGGATIIATLPAGAAGSAVITVTNAAGTSDPLPYTRGA